LQKKIDAIISQCELSQLPQDKSFIDRCKKIAAEYPENHLERKKILEQVVEYEKEQTNG
jgi:hypothetical protein